MGIARLLKSKVSFSFDFFFSYCFFLLFSDFKVLPEQLKRLKFSQIFISLHCCFNHIFLIFLSVGASLMPPPPLSSQKLSAIKNYLKHDTRIVEVGQKDGMKSRIKPIFKCNSNIWMFFFFPHGFQRDGPARCRLKLGFVNGFILSVVCVSSRN